MEEAIRTRLKLINDSVESLITSGRDALVKLRENTIPLEEARITASKLKAMNERFISEMYNYYKLVQTPSADELSTYTSIQMQAEEIVAEIDARIVTPKQNTIHIPPTETPNLNVTSRLPRMELARFDGDVLKWHQFWDRFSSNVDSRNINDVDKLLYLQSVLGGEAKQAIEGLETTSTNYKIAVDTLKERYGKPGAIVDAHYVALYRIKTAGSSVKECRSVLNEIERHLRVLKSLGEDVNHNHLRVMIMEKFPEDLIYELRMKLSSDSESIDSIRKNLEHIISARETSNRLRKEVTKPDNIETSTVEAFHVSSENKHSNYKHKGTKNVNVNKTERNRNYDNNNKSGYINNKKRRFESNGNSQHGEPTPKRTRTIKCVFCDKEHFNDECSTVKSIQERKKKLVGRCYNCLGEGHKADECKSKRKCRHCGKFGLHNRALCPNIAPNQIPTKTMHVKVDRAVTVLQTCTVHVYRVGDSTKYLNCRILLDCGSQRSYITKGTAKKLDLPTIEENHLSVFTFGAKEPQEIDSALVQFEIVTRMNKSKTIYANVVPSITQSVPCPVRNIQNVENFLQNEEIVLADDGSRNDEIDILLGNDYYYSFISNLKIEVEKNLFLVKTDFGWIWSGQCPILNDRKDELSVLTYFQSSGDSETHFYEPDLPLRCDNLKQLWDLESIGIVDSPKCSRDDEAITHFNDTTEFVDNRYFVKWPWTEYPPAALPVNFGMAYGRLSNLIKRLDSDTIREYDEVLQDQLRNGIIEKVDESFLPQDHPVHYLPHHCVLQDGKSTKLRIVYDASAKTKQTSSLNECLYRGPLMLEELTGLLIRFREHNIAIVADVEKAFLQIGLQPNDRDVTRFLWLKNLNEGVTSENLQHLRFCRVPFGVISSPFLLNATVRHHLNKSHDEINKQIAQDIYVDNLVTGSRTVYDALKLYQATKESFRELSMNLRQWNSNSKKFISTLPQEDQDKNDLIKILGIQWDTNKDELRLTPNYEKSKTMNTKRGVLKVTASIYDPCGYVAPIVLPAKVLLQELWRIKVKWDEEMSLELKEKWQHIISSFDNIAGLSIPRLYSAKATLTHINGEQFYELHCFSDASLQAYAAVVYLRGYDGQGSGTISFVLGKSRLAPMKDQKDLQIPRLELLGAVIGNRLLQYVAKFLRLPIDKQFLWVDSEIVLSWYNSERLLPPFVARRIAELKQNKNLHMKYVPTNLNPADGATRPINTTESNKYWLEGPHFLTLPSSQWPIKSRSDAEDIQMSAVGEGLSEDRLTQEYEEISENQERWESETDKRDKETKRDSNKETRNDTIDVEMIDKEEEDADKEINEVIQLQKKYFPREVEGQKTDLSKSLDLFKDEKGILRCGGRFKYASWTDDRKYPILLPKDTDFTTRVIENVHKINYHVGVGHTLALVRNKYWILRGRSQVQKTLRNCLQCRKYGGGPYKMPLMPPLPPERVRYSSPFTFTGLDYFGPLKVQEGGNTEKRWVCLFTCLSIRAIHMEVVKDLTAEECVMAIRRFISVRGLPQVITSDNATQFKLTSDVLTSDYCMKNKISWRFIPELAPWFGGFYERLIGIVKNCLKRTLDKHLINHTQLATVIKEVEAVVNTRPLTTVGQELEQVLTPADFLRFGRALVTDISDKEFTENATTTKDSLIQSWKYGQVILQEYIKMFTSHYLTSLRERSHVHKQSRVVVNEIPNVGDLVQIKGDHNRAFWKVGRISEVIKGTDGKIRVAKVLMPGGETLTRSINHLYPLEFADHNEITQDGHNQCPKHQSLKPHTLPNDDLVNSETALDLSRHDKSERPVESGEAVDASTSSRPMRASAQRARDKLKQWTQQLIGLILK